MKRVSWILFLIIGFVISFNACKEDDGPEAQPPSISSITPNTGAPGTAVTIAGSNFGTSPTVKFGTTNATVSSATNTSISTTVPGGLAVGAVDVTVTADGLTSSASSFTVEAPPAEAPVVSSFDPTSGFPGMELTITGANFSATAAENEVKFGDSVATVSAATETELTVTVPDLGPGQFTISVKVGDQTGNSTTQFEVPDIAAFEVVLHLMQNGNVVADPELAGIGREADQMLDPTPAAEVVTTDLAAYPDDDFFTEVAYKGAFDPTGTNWMEGWSSLWKLGYLVGAPSTPEAPYDPATATIETLPNSITQDMELTSDKVWKIDGLTYVEGGTLSIQPGTVIIAETAPTTGDNTSALVITTGGMIDAPGTADLPIIFTTEEDDGTLLPDNIGQWGGVILLGTAPIGFGTGTNSIEGIDPNEPRGQYGGSDADDNSGTMTYVSIRYTGVAIDPGSEIQGLSLGGVGNGTTLQYIDIFSSGDDGIEFFGGTVDVKYAIAAFVDDDCWDYDLGWSGNGQFWFSIQNDEGKADHGGEWDGADPDNAEPYSNPVLYNLTMIGRGQDATGRDVTAPAVIMRDNTAGTFANSIIADFNGKGIEVEDLADSDGDSYNRLINGEIHLMNNVWQVNANYTDLTSGETGIVKPTE